ncbi:hypothetical protein MTP02_27430 [Streptomyces albus]|uniref:Uncharacterized protein n=1 Tax=Streptomyces albidoflavus TaxID=1886 RepID=A0AA37C1B0_9ACTN|nr:hypothetical protein MTP02_27430 [Streptomyces albus]GHI46829.1 hypothetical protein ScoT_30030 [Streptomyces albidoflavus]
MNERHAGGSIHSKRGSSSAAACGPFVAVTRPGFSVQPDISRRRRRWVADGARQLALSVSPGRCPSSPSVARARPLGPRLPPNRASTAIEASRPLQAGDGEQPCAPGGQP